MKWMILFFITLTALFMPESIAQSTMTVTDDPLKKADALDSLRAKGLLIFTTPFSRARGFGDGPFIPSETQTVEPGKRPTLQGNGSFLRINGLDAQSCNECHMIIKHGTFPPTLGIGGVGGIATTALIQPTMVDVADSFDIRTKYVYGFDPDSPMNFDGKCDFNGRASNPPFLFGGGGIELLAKEMTSDLQTFLSTARNAAPGTVTRLITHTVDFGEIVSGENGDVDLSGVTGILPEETTGLTPEQMLVIRPFGRKGDNFSMREFDRNALQFHFGIQSVEVVGQDVDEDLDGIVNEATIEELTYLHIFSVTNPPPFTDNLNSRAQAGFTTFQSIGCTYCHIPEINTDSSFLPLAFPEVETDPAMNVHHFINLKDVGFHPSQGSGKGIRVPLFADFKRHKMGPFLTESFEKDRRVFANDEFQTARLWGVADTKPYLHDGRATSLTEAIDQLGGEAQFARDEFFALATEDREDVLYFLSRLRTPDNPNEELLDLAASLAAESH